MALAGRLQISVWDTMVLVGTLLYVLPLLLPVAWARMKSMALTNRPRIAGIVDPADLPFKGNSCDLVVSVDVTRHLTDPIEAVREISRVSRKCVTVQSATGSGIMSPLRFASLRWFRRHHESVRTEFSSAPFEGDLWYMSSRLLIELDRYAGQIFGCSKVIGHSSALIGFSHLPFGFRSDEHLLNGLDKLADEVDNSLAERSSGRYMGLLEKEGEQRGPTLF